MSRSIRLAIFGGTLLILVGGTALASQLPRQAQQGPAAASQQPEAPPTADEVAHAVERLSAHGIDVTAAELSALAADHGLGGAVRLVAWADQTGKSVEDIAAMRLGDADTAPMGWGQIAKELGVHPGLGSIMGNGGGHGRENAPGPQPDS
jgi:hypothetical protein